MHGICGFSVILCLGTVSLVGSSGCATSATTDDDITGDVDGGTPDAQSCERDEDCVDDGIFCNGGMVCRAGTCRATEPPSCGDGILCTVDSCDEELAGCVNMPNDEMCDEGFVCNQGEGCSIPPACEFDSDCADDEFVCNGAPTCEDNECVSEPLDCDDQDACTEDTCQEGMEGCVNTPYDNQNDPMHCGPNCQPCPAPTPQQVNTVAVCNGGECGFECEPGYWDVDMDTTNGCEVECDTDPLNTPDIPDDQFQDENCDGIDGTAADGIFVAEDGSNANPGTREFPVKTITFALSKAQDEGKPFVYVSAGTYAETVDMVEGIGIHGGYLRASDWARDGTKATITGPHTGVLKAANIGSPTIAEYLKVESSNATTPGTSSHALVVVDSDEFRPRHMTVIAGDGADGLSGASTGQAGDDGGNGAPGPNGYEDDGYFYCAGNAPDPPAYQEGGASCQGGSTAGGRGGRGCKTNGDPCPGDNGRNGAGPAGSRGYGAAGQKGGDGQPGGDGSPGTDGDGGSGGFVVSNQWVPQDGDDGDPGDDGGGGGGGAGGGSNHSTGTCNDWGGGGGGGGGGGCGGTGGDGGHGGGASIGILLVSSIITSEYVEVSTGAGGDGGAGRDGGTGGPGGNGASGGSGYDESRDGGRGADGGDGGRGGHGGGGAGGWSVCVYATSGSSYDDNGTGTLTPGPVGLGGSSSGNSGANGQAHAVFP